jgi:hypothetical protein
MSIIHIVGINTFIKDDIIAKIRDMKFELFDLDLISKNILFTENKTEMGKLWKTRLQSELDLFLSKNNNKNIVVIGLSNFVLDHRYKININTKHKYFLNIPYDICSSQLITFNLDNYREDIIDGKFPIKYIEHSFLVSQRKNLQEEYVFSGYKLKNLEQLFSILDQINNIKKEKNNKVYLAFNKRFEDNIPDSFIGSKPIIYGYTEKWMAIASILPKNFISRGLLKNNNRTEPYIKELSLKAFDNLQKPCYIYEFNSIKDLDKFRSEINNTKFIGREYVSNMYDELSSYGVILETFKF